MCCHGMTDDKMAIFWPDFAEALAAKKLSSLRFDFSGNGESEGEFVLAGFSREVTSRLRTPAK